jgi:hypothetical protein
MGTLLKIKDEDLSYHLSRLFDLQWFLLTYAINEQNDKSPDIELASDYLKKLKDDAVSQLN